MNSHLISVILICLNFKKMISAPLKNLKTLNRIRGSPYNNGIGQVESNALMQEISNNNIIDQKGTWQTYPHLENIVINIELSPWPAAQIPYIINESFTQVEFQLIVDSFQEFHAHTCVRFVPYNGESAYVHITPSGNGCHSSVGYTGNNYDVHLMSPNCMLNKGTVTHELMHVIGFAHEQSRHDRDDYVVIQWSNIQSGEEFNFFKLSNQYVNDFGLPYDFGSLMHYSDDAFAGNGGKTIIPKVFEPVLMGQRDGLSPVDVAKINRMYKCPLLQQ